MAKFALCFVNGGRVGDRQLIPEWYVKEATSRQIDNTLSNTTVEGQQGYGYQFWRLTHNAFATLGMGSQNAICLPDQDLILVVTGDTQEKPNAMQNLLDGLWNIILPSLSDEPLAENRRDEALLLDYMASRELLVPEGAVSSCRARDIAGKTYVMSANDMGITRVRFAFPENANGGCDSGVLFYENATGAHTLHFGLGRNIPQAFPETHYYGTRIGEPAGRGLECTVGGAWVMENALYINTWITDLCFGSLRMQFTFDKNEQDGDTVTMLAAKNAEWFLQEYIGFASGKYEGGDV